MNVHLLTSASEFLDRTRDFRAREPYLTNVIGSTASSIAAGRWTYESVSFWILEGPASEVQGIMMRTAPHKLVISPMPRNGVGLAAASVLAHDPGVPGVSGPRDVVKYFVEQLVERSEGRVSVTLERGTLVYVLGLLTVPTPPSGFCRVAGDEDFEMLRLWWIGFGEDTATEMYGFEESLRASITEGRIFLWCDNDRPVCAVAHSPVVVTPGGPVARIGPVYTPPSERRQGFADVLTATVSRKLREQGFGLMLFTDAANPTSNGVYTRLGYEKIAEVDEYAFVPR